MTLSSQTLSEENYLKTIYTLSRNLKGKVSLTMVAEALSNNPASVVDMIRKLADKQLVAYEKARGISLTETGQRSAVHIIRRHRLWEVFLHDKLAYNWDEIHDIAEQLEHIHHHDLADRLDQFLGFPEYDPHGDPIPNAKGELPVASTLTLAELEPGAVCTVTGVRDTSTAFLQYLGQLAVGIGTSIAILEKIGFDESLVLRIAGERAVTVSKKFAENLVVKAATLPR
ncbi:MAG: metal-dependent transcriptional regulator [Chitinophagia bacterium]|nr:metal-dependent transcriptional regulator [Chitinophagia bacterium]